MEAISKSCHFCFGVGEYVFTGRAQEGRESKFNELFRNSLLKIDFTEKNNQSQLPTTKFNQGTSWGILEEACKNPFDLGMNFHVCNGIFFDTCGGIL